MSIKDMPYVTVEAVSALRTEAIKLEQQRDDLLEQLIYLQSCIEFGKEPAMSKVNQVIREAQK